MEILFVCAGNLFRSVLSERVFNARASELLGEASRALTAVSSGLEADSQDPPHPEARRALGILGLPPNGDPPSRTDIEHLRGSDLAVAMTRQQCYVMASRFAEQARKCFSLIEINGAVATLLRERGAYPPAADTVERARALGPEGLARALVDAAAAILGAPRESLYPLADVPIPVRELMTRFLTCFNQVSAVHDPVGGTPGEIESCARQIEREVSELLLGLLALAVTSQS